MQFAVERVLFNGFGGVQEEGGVAGSSTGGS